MILPTAIFCVNTPQLVLSNGERFRPWFINRQLTREVDDGPKFDYFRATRGRKENDVCHSRLVSPVPWATSGIIPVRYVAGNYTYVALDRIIQKSRTSSSLTITASVCDGTSYSYSVRFQWQSNYRCIATYWIYSLESFSYEKGKWKWDNYGNAGHTCSVTWRPGESPSYSNNDSILRMRLNLLNARILSKYGNSLSEKPILKVLDEAFAYLRDCRYRAKVSNFKDVDEVWNRCGIMGPYTMSNIIEPDPTFKLFLLHEPEVIFDKLEDVSLGKGDEKYWRDAVLQNAFVDAMGHIPRMSDNMISNLLEIGGTLLGLVTGSGIEIPSSIPDIWLAYRYQYGTTRLDIHEAADFLRRKADVGAWKSFLTFYGGSSVTYKDVDIQALCSLSVRPKIVGQTLDAIGGLLTYGLKPNPYVIWDIIPYSFVVDWFIPVGDLLGAEVDFSRLKQYYDIRSTVYSLTYVREHLYGFYKTYSRWSSQPPRALNGFYFWEDQPSSKTGFFRMLDGVSLLLG